MSNLIKNLLFALALAVFLWLGYWFFMRNTEENLTTISITEGSSQDVTLKAQEFKTRLAELKSMEIDSKILSDMRFVSLKSFRQPIPEEPTGRSNPFAPLE